MGLFKAELDLSELNDFVKDLDNAEEKVQDVLTATARDLATEALSLIIDNTSVITGELKASWKIGEVVVRGDAVEIDVYSDLYYAAWYEYGHAQTPGRFVPAIGKRLVKSWVPGRFTMTIQSAEAVKMAPEFLAENMKELMTW